MSEPTRTCIGCRESADQVELLRFVLVKDDDSAIAAVHPDLERKLPGRGAYLHSENAQCLELAIRKRAFARAFRQQVDTTKIVSALH